MIIFLLKLPGLKRLQIVGFEFEGNARLTALANLTQLNTLDLENYQLEITDLKNLQGLKALRSLNLFGSVWGADRKIIAKEFRALFKAVPIKTLAIDTGYLNDLNFLAGEESQIEELQLKNSPDSLNHDEDVMASQIASLAQIKTLKHLTLGDKYTLQKLQTLSFEKLTDLVGLESLTVIGSIDVDDFGKFQNMPRLKKLHIGKPASKRQEILKTLSVLPSLQLLSLPNATEKDAAVLAGYLAQYPANQFLLINMKGFEPQLPNTERFVIFQQ